MIILGIESSCDETAAAVVQKQGNRVLILSNIVASSATLQAKYGGIIPEQAAREQLKSIIPVIKEALKQAFPNVIPSKEGIYKNNYYMDPRLRGDDRIRKIDAVAITSGPGLIGSLLVGVETAKTLALVWNKPLIPVNHLIGHFYANWISDQSPVISSQLSVIRFKSDGFQITGQQKTGKPKSENRKQKTDDRIPTFPCVGLLVSGGHTDLVLFQDHGKYQYLGGTRDDAAGECFDKCARLLGLPYPGGPAIAAEAAKCKVQGARLASRAKWAKCKIDLPRPLINEKTFDFSFSGLKTAASREVDSLKSKKQFNSETIAQLASEIQAAIVDVLVEKTIKAAQTYKVEQIMIAGGVAANQELIRKCKVQSARLASRAKWAKCKIKLHVPPPELCTDNAAMVAAAAFFNYHPINPLILQADPNLTLSA